MSAFITLFPFRLVPGAAPQIEIQYKSLTVEADAAVGLSDNPSLWNSVAGVLNSLLLRGGANKQPLRILDGVNGALQPVRGECGRSWSGARWSGAGKRIHPGQPSWRSVTSSDCSVPLILTPPFQSAQGKLTLLIGPPGSGKSVFLQALSGRLKPHGGLRVSPACPGSPGDGQRACILTIPPGRWRDLVPESLTTSLHLAARTSRFPCRTFHSLPAAPGTHLQVSGSIEYNGQLLDSFMVQRAAGLVDQCAS